MVAKMPRSLAFEFISYSIGMLTVTFSEPLAEQAGVGIALCSRGAMPPPL
jgi:hypothetical protein